MANPVFGLRLVVIGTEGHAHDAPRSPWIPAYPRTLPLARAFNPPGGQVLDRIGPRIRRIFRKPGAGSPGPPATPGVIAGRRLGRNAGEGREHAGPSRTQRHGKSAA